MLNDLLEILADRYGLRSTIITSQLPPPQWHDYLGDATLADAICDRLLHNAHRLVLRTLAEKGGEARRLTDGPASLRADIREFAALRLRHRSERDLHRRRHPHVRVTVNPSAGSRTVTITNPDGQRGAGPGCFTVFFVGRSSWGRRRWPASDQRVSGSTHRISSNRAKSVSDE